MALMNISFVSSYLYENDDLFYSWSEFSDFEDRLSSHLDFLKSVRYDLRGGDREHDNLIMLLQDFNWTLRQLTPTPTIDVVDRRVFELMTKDITRDVDRTRRLEEGATREALLSKDKRERARYNDLSKLANFGLATQASNAEMSRKKIFSIADFSFDSPYYFDKNTTLARLFDYPFKHQSRLVLVEWMALSKSASTSSILETLDETKVTWYILHAEKPQKILLPATIGLIFDEASPRSIGLVYQLPPHIRGNLPTKTGGRIVRSPKAIAAERMPTSLRQLILKKDPDCSDLGIRFKLAKQLVDAVYMMHATKFTHRYPLLPLASGPPAFEEQLNSFLFPLFRNIRPDNILLFPSAGPNGDPDPSRLDYDNPVLFGFHDARLEIQISTDPPPSHTQPTGIKPILKNPHRRPARDVVLDCYTHPERRIALAAAANPRTNAPTPSFRRQHDLYSVGCVLLELGLWETLDAVSGREIGLRAPLVADVEELGGVVVGEEAVWKDAEVVRRVARGLDVITGSVYAEVTRMYLSLNPISGDLLEFERRAAAMLAQIAA
ncbi:hypothetical protein NEMBOFW57_006818 [Staphylotrichum longicolle]|uniref:Protein kinase domain-containing protein n=1 Tax=Staphylotrichum longicolle TaxID=669026 RepID=A0AAD4ETL4_9PEZI|nr:hypothetical protein NEMBOFW57_006818 [Staphylotrichum longicolle]